jgi:hypothetical protein
MLIGQPAREHGIERNSHGPHINPGAIILRAKHHFRRRIARRSTGRGHHLGSLLILHTQSKINQLQIVPIHNDILGFYIAMANIVRMKEFDCFVQLQEVFARGLKGEGPLFCYLLVELAARRQLGYYEDLFRGLFYAQ